MHGHKQVSLLKYVVFTNTKEMNIKYPLITLSNYNLFPFILNLVLKLNKLTKMNNFIHTDWLSLDMKITTMKTTRWVGPPRERCA